MPVIAIAPCGKLPDYEESVRRAGGDVRALVRTADSPADIVASVQGVLLTGGGDVLPAIYGAIAHPTFDPAEPGRDEYEIELVRLALAADLPVFAICRGIQVLNVARGGTLIQDIVDEVGTTVNHRVVMPQHSIAHDVWIESGSLLERLMGERFEAGEACPVNSRHHQAPKALGEGLISSATAPDGVIEAIEDPTRRFCLGVQWHPENFYRTGEFRNLFEGFVQACKI
jgi:putative glutamine amidotransferase